MNSRSNAPRKLRYFGFVNCAELLKDRVHHQPWKLPLGLPRPTPETKVGQEGNRVELNRVMESHDGDKTRPPERTYSFTEPVLQRSDQS